MPRKLTNMSLRLVSHRCRVELCLTVYMYTLNKRPFVLRALSVHVYCTMYNVQYTYNQQLGCNFVQNNLNYLDNFTPIDKRLNAW